MSQASSIEWTDATWNPVRGCTKVSPGCKHCYAETFAERFRGVKGHPYEQGFDLRLVPEKLAEPLSWRKPRLVFVNSMSDLFHEDVPNEYIAAVFGVMAATPRHTYQILTKRSERMRPWFEWIARYRNGGMQGPTGAIAWACVQYVEHLPEAWRGEHGAPMFHKGKAWESWRWPLPNVHLGVSVEGPNYLHRIDDLLACPAAVRWVSLEPLLAGVDISPWLGRVCSCPECDDQEGPPGELCSSCGDASYAEWRGLDWVVVGGESGPKARPFDVAWARRIVADCRTAGVPCFVKQLGARPMAEQGVDFDLIDLPRGFGTGQARSARDGVVIGLHGELALRSRKGGDPAEWPEDLRVREWPEARS